MARKTRVYSNNGFYHIRDIGIDHFAVFSDYKDRRKFREILQAKLEDSGVTIVAYCIMNNHFHLLAAGEKENISKYLKSVKSRFAQWYNFKYERSGPLFDSRYRGEPIKDMDHFWEVLRYIHLNPLRGGFVKTVDEYEFSSYNCYVGKRDKLVDPSFVLAEMDETDFIAWHYKVVDFTKFKMFKRTHYLVDEQAMEIITEVVGSGNERKLGDMDRPMLNLVLAELKRRGLAIRQISRLTGIPRGIVEKAKSKNEKSTEY